MEQESTAVGETKQQGVWRKREKNFERQENGEGKRRQRPGCKKKGRKFIDKGNREQNKERTKMKKKN